jgi:hypothetical protein
MLDQLTHSDFSRCLNQVFLIHFNETECLETQLIQVRVLGQPYKPGKREPFSLIFSSPIKDRYLVQGTYPIEHETMGTLEIFISALGPDDKGMNYEAIFT